MCPLLFSHYGRVWLFCDPMDSNSCPLSQWCHPNISSSVHQAPLSRGFHRQEYWSGLPCPPPGELPDPGTKSTSSALQKDLYLYNGQFNKCFLKSRERCPSHLHWGKNTLFTFIWHRLPFEIMRVIIKEHLCFINLKGQRCHMTTS